MDYNKDLGPKKEKKIIGGSGPRDLQRRQQSGTGDLKALQTQIESLMNELAQRPAAPAAGQGVTYYTAEEFDEELIKQVSSIIKDPEGAYTKEINILEEKIRKLEIEKIEHLKELESLNHQLKMKEELLASKDETIESLKSRPLITSVAGEVVVEEDPERPKMETVFIDPSSKEDGKNMKSYITLESKEDDNIGDKVNKLKSLMGGLPK